MEILRILGFVLYAVVLARVILTVLLERGSPARSLAWTLFIIVAPVIGIGSYFLFGKRVRKRRLFQIKHSPEVEAFHRYVQSQHENYDRSDIARDPILRANNRLIALLAQNGYSLLTAGNKVEVLQDGTVTFQSIMEAIRQAEQSISILYYIIEEGEMADQLFALLAQKKKEGVVVRVIFDGFGSWFLSRTFLKKIRASGIDIHPFVPLSIWRFFNKINYRNHRKIVVVDGRIGFTGGINISDKYIHGDPELGHWRDTHLRLEGPAVSGLQFVFLTDWYFVSGKYLIEQGDLFPRLQAQGNTYAQIIAGGPNNTFANIKQQYFAMITGAHRYVIMATPYFIPGENILFAMKTAALSGVHVRLILPYNSDSIILKWSVRAYLEELMEAGVEVFFYYNGFLHSKIIIADDVASIGTANVDERSFEHNFEVNALLYDPVISRELKQQLEADLVNCKQLDPEAFQKRPRRDKIRESIVRLLEPLL
ncbi:cardiolipin synthase [Flavilitoribacter nigricans]|uniref:Cardiolipin synthase n=1 Tax=Flavilitoribacter nigricans (strain ATCC 23147 / DSM 23189 / NBRC 102662 / NCIMB 1420 / SS-2) TaxID=1122177 RepID=A0A2D0MZZ1_FLAN2|nr:cardiolipin synthase [Flavilitoribacter nigricans]PHN01698.1 cardiolipin synthase [Flavilitoribacter nigricans DSM 23189 = NBRC 102662]